MPLSDDQKAVIGCHVCQKLCRVDASQPAAWNKCPRCGSKLHLRKPDSINRTWALVLTALFLYIPANIFPIMQFKEFGGGEPQTIISSVVHLYASGMWPLAILVFAASIFVPVLKIITILMLLISVQMKWQWRPRERTILFRAIEVFGRWSMIDIFMISILVALVNLGQFARILAGPGATAFAAVVVLTILASLSFDPRYIWDNINKSSLYLRSIPGKR